MTEQADQIIDKARAEDILKKDRDERMNRCQKRIEAILLEENCFIDTTVSLSRSGISPSIIIIAK